MQTERDPKAVLSSQRVPVTFHFTDPVSIQYMKHLTPYACKYISQQLANRTKVKLKSTNLLIDFSDENQVFEVQISGGVTIPVSTKYKELSVITVDFYEATMLTYFGSQKK